MKAKSIGLGFALIAGLLLGGCHRDSSRDTFSAEEREEFERLRQLESEVVRLRAENQEIQRLKRENQEVHRLRGQYQELVRLREENEKLQKQLAALAAQPRSASQREFVSPQPVNPISPPGPIAQLGTGEIEQMEEFSPEFAREENDQILLDPQDLPLLFPDYDWSKLQRSEPIIINEMLETHGIVITNYQQLIQWGVTNYQVQRIADE
jgi:hypothetical protein